MLERGDLSYAVDIIGNDSLLGALEFDAVAHRFIDSACDCGFFPPPCILCP